MRLHELLTTMEHQVFRDPHSKSLLLTMNRLRKEQQLCDVILRVQGKEFPAHRIVLAASSDYFCAMFTNNLSEKKQSVIELHEITSNVFEMILDFVYTEVITVTIKNVQDLLPAACLLQLKGIKFACTTFLQKQLDSTNCLGIKNFAERHSCEDLFSAAQIFCHRNFAKITRYAEFLNLPIEEVFKLVSCDDLQVSYEESVYESVIKWVKHDADKRTSHLYELMKHVRLPLLSAEYITDIVDEQVLLKRCHKCRDLLDEAKKFHLRPDLRSVMSGPRFKPRTGIDDVMVVIGGFGMEQNILDAVEMYRPKTDEWIQLPNLNRKKRFVSAAAVGSVLYIMGGFDGMNHFDSVECMDFSLEELVWKPVASMSYRRGLAGVTVHAGMVYICGGFNGKVRLSSMERYSPIINKWETVGNLSMGREGMTLALGGDCIYFIGGFDGFNALDIVEKFDIMTGEFSPLCPMISKRSAAGVAVMNNTIYACGGYVGIQYQATVECYDIIADQWTDLHRMRNPRCYVGACILNEKLLLVAGYDGNDILNTVDCYDPMTDSWKTMEKRMNTRRCDPGVAVVQASLHCTRSY